MALTGLAGPVSNLVLALISAFLMRGTDLIISHATLTSFGAQALVWLELLFYIGVRLNITLAVFNLIPVPPLDGSRIFLVLLPTNLYFKIMQYEKYIYIALMVALFFGVLDTPTNFLTNLFTNIIFNVAF